MSMLDLRFIEVVFSGFEKDYEDYPVPIRFTREDKRLWGKEIVYQHKLTNSLFVAYYKGYQRSKFDEEVRNRVMLSETSKLAIECSELKQQLKEARELIRLREVVESKDLV